MHFFFRSKTDFCLPKLCEQVMEFRCGIGHWEESSYSAGIYLETTKKKDGLTTGGLHILFCWVGICVLCFWFVQSIRYIMYFWVAAKPYKKNVQCSVFANKRVLQSRLWRKLHYQIWNIMVEMPSCVGGNAVDLMRCVKSDYLHTSTQATHKTPSRLSYFTVGGLVVIDRQNLFTRCWQCGSECLVKMWYLIARIKLTNYLNLSILSVMCTVKRIHLW